MTPLPGARTAGLRMAQWACGAVPLLPNARTLGQTFLVEHIDDSEEPVTIDRLSKRIKAALDDVSSEEQLKRLVIFFSGHGSAKDLDENYWLLSNWKQNSTEAVHVPSLQRVLGYYDPTQVSLIGDACRVIHKNFAEVRGSAILPRPDELLRKFELDRFFAVDGGEAAYMVKAKENDDAFCIFTETLLDALLGKDPAALDKEIAARSVVTNSSLAAYLAVAVPDAARKHNVTMTPDPYPGFYTDRIYAEFPHKPGKAAEANGGMIREPIIRNWRVPLPKGLREMLEGIVFDDAVSETKTQQTKLATVFGDALANAPAAPKFAATKCGLIVNGVDAGGLAVLAGGQLLSSQGGVHELQINEQREGIGSADLAILMSPQKTAYVCAVSGFASTLTILEGDALALSVSSLREQDSRLRDFERRLLAAVNAGALSKDERIEASALLRNRKHIEFVLGVIPAYLYDSVGDVEGVRKLASYYPKNSQGVPLDVALLSGGRIYPDQNGELRVDIVATEARAPRTDAERKFAYAVAETQAYHGVRVLGRAPWMRAGWGALLTANLDPKLARWREAGLEAAALLAPAPFTLIAQNGLATLQTMVRLSTGG